MPDDKDLNFIIGRLEGKLDSLVLLQGTITQRLDAIEARIANAERAITALESSKNTSRTIFTDVLSVVSLFIAGVALYFGYDPA